MSRYSVELADSTGLLKALNGRRARWLNAGAVANDSIAMLPDASAPAPVRHVHGERDFGIGYGNSSGYGTDRHYAREWSPQRFSCR